MVTAKDITSTKFPRWERIKHNFIKPKGYKMNDNTANVADKAHSLDISANLKRLKEVEAALQKAEGKEVEVKEAGSQ